MGGICEKPKTLDEKVFNFNEIEDKILHNLNSEDLNLKKPEICEIFLRAFSINFKNIESKKGDSPIEISRQNSLNSLSSLSISNIIQEQEREKFDNDIFNDSCWNEINFMISKIINNSNSFRSLNSSNEEKNFSMKIISEINSARTNNIDYAKKIEDLLKNVELEKSENYNTPYLKINIKGENLKYFLTTGIKPFKESSYYIKNLKEKLHEFMIINEINISFLENEDENNQDVIQKKVKALVEKVRGLYQIIAVNLLFIDSFDDPEMSIIISLVDGDHFQDIRKNIFSKEITHIMVYTKTTFDYKRVIYCIFLRII
jgi:hypothetical protein